MKPKMLMVKMLYIIYASWSQSKYVTQIKIVFASGNQFWWPLSAFWAVWFTGYRNALTWFLPYIVDNPCGLLQTCKDSAWTWVAMGNGSTFKFCQHSCGLSWHRFKHSSYERINFLVAWHRGVYTQGQGKQVWPVASFVLSVALWGAICVSPHAQMCISHL